MSVSAAAANCQMRKKSSKCWGGGTSKVPGISITPFVENVICTETAAAA